jgi:hypothetical protein
MFSLLSLLAAAPWPCSHLFFSLWWAVLYGMPWGGRMDSSQWLLGCQTCQIFSQSKALRSGNSQMINYCSAATQQALCMACPMSQMWLGKVPSGHVMGTQGMPDTLLPQCVCMCVCVCVILCTGEHAFANEYACVCLDRTIQSGDSHKTLPCNILLDFTIKVSSLTSSG